MRRLACLTGALLLAGCAAQPLAPGAQVSERSLRQGIVPGQTTKVQLLAGFGPTKSVVFDSGYETWLYHAPPDAGRYVEFVVLIDPRGVVAKTRSSFQPLGQQ